MKQTFSLLPENSDSIPGRKQGVKAPKKKSWELYIEYFDECYMEYLNRTPPARSVKSKLKYKRLIETAVAHWGEDTFKSMIKWICKHASEYPQLTIDINLVVGTHGWANHIAQKAQEEQGTEYHTLEEL